MSKFEFCVRADSWCYVTSRRVFSASEEQVQGALDALDPSLNPFNATAAELRHYVNGIGELALRVQLAGAYKGMQALLARVAQVLAMDGLPYEDSEPAIMQDSADPIRVIYEWSRFS
jgi:hypothetical protein